MKKPQMILFDYGHTLLYEQEFSFLRGEQAVFEYITENPHNVTSEQSNDFANKLFADFDRARQLGFEIHEWQALRTQYERLGLKFSLPMDELETVMWDAVSVGERMLNVAEMLAYLKSQGIRTGVISNIGWSGFALTRRRSGTAVTTSRRTCSARTASASFRCSTPATAWSAARGRQIRMRTRSSTSSFCRYMTGAKW